MTIEEMNEIIYDFFNMEEAQDYLDNDDFQGIYSQFRQVFHTNRFNQQIIAEKDYWQLLCRFSEFLYIDCKIEIFKFLKSIPYAMFYKSKNLPSYLYIPSNIKVIGSNAFESCKTLDSVYIEDGCETIYDEVFKNCTSLYQVRLPSTILEPDDLDELLGNVIDDTYDIFKGCTNLKEIYVIKGSYMDKWCSTSKYEKKKVYQKEKKIKMLTNDEKNCII